MDLTERAKQEAMNGPLAEHIVMTGGDRILLRGRMTQIIIANYSPREVVELRNITA